MSLLREFVELGIPPQEARRRHREEVNSGNRKWRVTSRPGSEGAYPQPVRWALTTADVIAGGPDNYCDRVEEWARSTLESLRASGNYSPG
jgi:hypothetical protein